MSYLFHLHTITLLLFFSFSFLLFLFFFFFFFNDTATTEIYTLSLHDALPISPIRHEEIVVAVVIVIADANCIRPTGVHEARDRKSTRLNSSHGYISYAVFCLKKKKKKNTKTHKNKER